MNFGRRCSPMQIIKVDDRNGLNRELGGNEKVLALFYASWCPYCVAFVPTFSKKVQTNFGLGTVVHVLLDDYDNPLWDDYDIEAVPTIILFENGRVTKRLDGKFGAGLNEKQLSVWFKELC